MNDLNELRVLISKWAYDRGIYEHSTANAQLLKAMSEMGELADAEIKGLDGDKIDAIGDIVVCLINYAEMSGFTLNAAVAMAYEEIKDRKGRMVKGGAFVKEED
jgi:NTP pyrophosphatase (non-canonical NTP hydrolase)